MCSLPTASTDQETLKEKVINIYELYGRQAETNANNALAAAQSRKIIEDIASGKVLPSQLEISKEGVKVRELTEADLAPEFRRLTAEASENDEDTPVLADTE